MQGARRFMPLSSFLTQKIPHELHVLPGETKICRPALLRDERLLSIINTKYGPIYKDLYFPRDEEGAQELAEFL